MRTLIAVGCAGAAGAVARILIGQLMPPASGFPVGTFAVNIAGAFILCFLVERTLQWTLVDKTAFDAITVGFLGAFTTFSAFSYESAALLESQTGMGLLYIALSISIGLFAGALGSQLGGKEQT